MKSVKKIIKNIISCFSLKNWIIFESIPDFSDNTRAVFDEMIKRNMNQKYKMIWLVKDKRAKMPQIKNVIYVDKKTFIHKIEFYRYALFAKCLIFCNDFLYKYNEEQFSIYLTHGSAIKSVKNYYYVPESVDYCLAASKAFEKIVAHELSVDERKMISLGYPRNDVFCKKAICLQSFFETQYKKIVVWYPTFRQHKNGNSTAAANALPVIHDAEKAEKLNQFAKQNDVLIVLKPHFAQDVSYIQSMNLSNIVLINDEFFEENNLTSYEFVGSCDAMLTDYSSIYYDYTLCDKPIGVIWEDIDEYRKNPGFAVDLDYFMKGAEKIYNLEEFMNFIKNVAEGKDVLKEQRTEIRDFVNYSPDGQNSKRVVDFIVEKAKL